MEFFKSFRQERHENKDEKNFLKDIHPDFPIVEGAWRFNRTFSPFDRLHTIKTRFAFDDPSELKSTDLQAKIGINFDRSIPHKFIGFAYGSNRDEIEAYGRQYKWAEVIEDLNREGGSKAESVRASLI